MRHRVPCGGAVQSLRVGTDGADSIVGVMGPVEDMSSASVAEEVYMLEDDAWVLIRQHDWRRVGTRDS